jgi:hypothetical protein
MQKTREVRAVLILDIVVVFEVCSLCAERAICILHADAGHRRSSLEEKEKMR